MTRLLWHTDAGDKGTGGVHFINGAVGKKCHVLCLRKGRATFPRSSCVALAVMLDPSFLRSAGEYVEWLRLQVHEKELPANDRVRAAGGCLALAQEHHHAIVFLVEHSLYGSAFSLLRVAFEAYVRGVWLSLCAKNRQVAQFLRGNEPPKLDALLTELEATPAFAEQVLSTITRKHWRAMCAYTHTGGLHVQRWNTSDAIEPAYSASEVREVIAFAELVGSLAVLGLAEIANDEA